VRRGISLPRDGTAISPESRADEMMLGEEPLEILVCRSYVSHATLSLLQQFF
jgi:hypothetical protein